MDRLGFVMTFKIQPSWLEADNNILRISDTAGQEEYEHVRRLAYPGTDVLIIAFNIMERDSFDNITNIWIKDKNNHMKNAKVGKNMYCMDKIKPWKYSGLDGKYSMTKYS